MPNELAAEEGQASCCALCELRSHSESNVGALLDYGQRHRTGRSPLSPMLQRAATFADLGTSDLDSVDKHRTNKRLVRRLNVLGHAATLRPKFPMAHEHAGPGPPV